MIKIPNWCSNELSVRGDPKELKKFNKKARAYEKNTTALSLNKLYPMPKKLEKTINKPSKEGMPDWWKWRVEHWGTKWDVKAELSWKDYDNKIDSSLNYSFDSAWAPPVEWLKKVAKDFPTLFFSLKYDEPGMGFMGVAKGKNGAINDQILEY